MSKKPHRVVTFSLAPFTMAFRIAFLLCIAVHGAMSASKKLFFDTSLTLIAGSPCLVSTGAGAFPPKLRCWDGTTPNYILYSTACNGRGGRASCPGTMCALPSSNNGLNDFACNGFFGLTCVAATGNSARRSCGAFLFIFFSPSTKTLANRPSDSKSNGFTIPFCTPRVHRFLHTIFIDLHSSGRLDLMFEDRMQNYKRDRVLSEGMQENC